MRLLLVLMLLTLPAHAEDGTADSAAASAPVRAERAATVLDHALEVTVDSAGRLLQRQSWTVRIDDPAAATAGLPAPPGLDGAQDGGAHVFGELLVLPPGVQAGDVYLLEQEVRERRGPWSGVFRTAPDLSTLAATVTIQAPTWIPLTLWSDSRGAPTWSRPRRARRVSYAFHEVAPDAPAEVVWSTWHDWDQAGEQLRGQVEPRLAGKLELGSDLAYDLGAVSIAEAVDRINQQVRVSPEDFGSWASARAPLAVLEAGEGTAADRGMALLSLLRTAGYDARPAAFRPASASAGAPLTVPAPAALTRPAVAVVTEAQVVWIDPASDHTTVPDLPASMTGAVAWVPGRLPVRLASQGATDGQVSVHGQVRLGADGSATFTAIVTASGTAREWIRALLAPLGEEGRSTALGQLVIRGRPDLARFTASTTGLEDPRRPLKITLNGYEPRAWEPVGPGLSGTLAPIAAPALAAWLPTRILVHEELSVDPPPDLQPIATVPAEPTFHPEVVLARHLRREGDRLVLVTEALRPARVDTPARAAEAARFLAEHAESGPGALYFGLPSPQLAKEVRSIDALSAGERVAVEALLWTSAGDVARASRTLKKALKRTPPAEVVGALRQYADPADAAPWFALWDASEDPAVRIEVVQALERAGEERVAWLHAASLAGIADPEVRVRALRTMYRLQPDQRPNERIDAVGFAAWAPRAEIVTRAHEASRSIAEMPVGGDVPILLHKARRDLDRGRADEALPLLERILEVSDDPVALALRARAQARLGTPSRDAVRSIEEAVRRAPFDAEVIGQAARAMEEIGRPDKALEYGLSAARLDFTSSGRWQEATRQALRAGDLPTAAFAARRASDLAPEDRAAGETLQLVSTLLGDQEGATLGASRAGRPLSRAAWPDDLADLMGMVPPDALLALLQYHEEEVAATPRLLAMRAQLRLAAGLLEEAARDGTILATRHEDPRGHALTFAGTAGRVWSSSAVEALSERREDEQVRATRMEYGLVTGDADPVGDARVLGEDPRAAVILRTARGEVEAVGPEPSQAAPKGYRPNAVLGGTDGIAAWSDPNRATAVLLSSAPSDALPPPLAQLYTPREPDVASLGADGRLIELEGGLMPLFAATAPLGEHRVWAIGFTADAAEHALTHALTTWQ